MKKMAKEFKDFIAKGNVLDMAIGVIIAGAFGKITTSVVNDILMPVIGAIFGGASLTDTLNITLRAAQLDEAGEVVKPACVLGLGTLITAIIDFIIIALICFLIVKAFNKARAKAEAKKKEAEAAAAAAAEEEAKAKAEEEAAAAKEARLNDPGVQMLMEIRDLLKKQQ